MSKSVRRPCTASRDPRGNRRAASRVPAALSRLAEDGVLSVSSEELAAAAGCAPRSCARTSPTSAPTASAASATTSSTLALPDLPRARPDPGLAGRHRRHGQPRPRAGQLLRLRHRGLPRRRRCSTPTRPLADEHVAGVPIRPLAELHVAPRGGPVAIGVIATPAAAAQAVCDALVAAGISSILNFAPAVLSVPERRRRPQGRPLHRAADPRLPRAAQVARRGGPPVGGGRAMSLLVIGLSHHTAPLSVLEAALRSTPTAPQAIAASVLAIGHRRPRPSCSPPATASRSTPTSTGLPRQRRRHLRLLWPTRRRDRPTTLLPHLYVHYDDGAVAHLFTRRRRARLDGRRRGPDPRPDPRRARPRPGARHRRPVAQRRSSSRPCGSASAPTPRPTSTSAAPRWSRPRSTGPSRSLGPLAGPPALVVGAGAMARWPPRPLARPGADDRRRRQPHARARRAPRRPRRPALARAWSDLPDASPRPTSSSPAPEPPAPSSPPTMLAEVAARRDGRPQVVIDLALPHDVDPVAVLAAGVPGVTLVDLQALGRSSRVAPTRPQVAGVRELVTGEVAAYLTRRMEKSVAPTVAALRARAAALVATEMRPARPAAAGPRRDDARRGRARRAPDRREAAPHPDHAGQGVRHGGPAATTTPPPCASSSTSSPRTSPTCPPRRSGCSHDRPAPRHPPLRPRHHPVRLGRRPAARRSATRSSSSRSRPRATSSGGPARRHRRHRRLRRGPARALLDGRVDLAVHSLKDLPTAPEPASRVAAVPSREDPPRRPRRPRRPHPRRAARRRPPSAPARRAARPSSHALGLGLVDHGHPRQRRHPDAQGRRRASSTPSCWPRAGLRPPRPSRTRSPRCSTRSRCSPHPGQGALAVECRADDDAPRRRVSLLDDPDTRACVDAERALLADPRGRLLGPRRRAGRGRRGRRRPRAVAARRRRTPTAPSTCAARSSATSTSRRRSVAASPGSCSRTAPPTSCPTRPPSPPQPHATERAS